MAAASLILLALTSGCGLLPAEELSPAAAQTEYADLSGELREALEAEFGAIPAENPDGIPYSGSPEECSWYPESITVPNNLREPLLDDVVETVQPVLTDHGFGELREAGPVNAEPYFLATDEHGAEVTVTRRGDVRVGIEVPVDTGGVDCDPSVLP